MFRLLIFNVKKIAKGIKNGSYFVKKMATSYFVKPMTDVIPSVNHLKTKKNSFVC